MMILKYFILSIPQIVEATGSLLYFLLSRKIRNRAFAGFFFLYQKEVYQRIGEGHPFEPQENLTFSLDSIRLILKGTPHQNHS